MRMFKRPPVLCGNCGAKVYWEFSAPAPFGEGVVLAGREPPRVREGCPRCGAEIDTTTAYAAVRGFPAGFDRLKEAYRGFAPVWEHRRDSFEKRAREMLAVCRPSDLGHELSSGEGWEWYRQRLFYRCCASFYRSVQLFFGFLALQRRCFKTWADVTGYYSRFFFIQAFLNLILSTWDSLNQCFFYFDGAQVQCLTKRELSPTARSAGSHEVWWQLMEAVKVPDDYPLADLEFVLSRLVFSPDRRNNANYGFEYLGGGFIELDWFDSGAKQMMTHFMPYPRADGDITDIDRFFAGQDPEGCDAADFYGDESQILWCSLRTLLELLRALDFKQGFVLTENIAALAEVHLGNDYPGLMAGILTSTEEVLQTGFDVDAFLSDRESHPGRRSSFLTG